jgi:hypothetical protein
MNLFAAAAAVVVVVVVAGFSINCNHLLTWRPEGS